MNASQSQAIELTADSAAKIEAGRKALPELFQRQADEQESRNKQATALRTEIVKRTAPLLALERQVRMRAIPKEDLSALRDAWSTPIDVAKLAGSFDWPKNPDLSELDRDQSVTRFQMGEFGWVHTECHATPPLGCQAMSDGTHMFGHSHWGGDNLAWAVVGAIDHWVLPPERIPESRTGRFRSAPHADLFGRISGWTNYYHPIWAPDDKWCKVDLILRHSVWQLIGTRWLMCGERIDPPRRLIDLANDQPVGQAHHDLGGFNPMPVVNYGIFSRREPIWTQLEIKFVTALEGGADVWFSPGNGPAGSDVTRTFPWILQAS
jgi:hypothetical protein